MYEHIKNKNKTTPKKPFEPPAGMHPGGGYVAWPDEETGGVSSTHTQRIRTVCRGQRRKGFVAWPEKR